MNRQQLVMAVGALLFAACGGRTAGNQAKYEDLCSVEQTGTKQFALDDNTSNNISFLQYIPGDTLARLSLLNTHSNSIYLYDATSGNLLTTIPFDLEGADGVGQIQGYRYHNNDSIFVYPYGAGRVYLANSQGKVKEVYPLYEGITIEENEDSIMANPKFFPTDPYVDTANPMFYSNGKIFMAQGFFAETTLEREDNTSVNLSYDIATRTTEFSMPYSETYRKHDWGGNFFYRHPSVAMTADGKQLFSYSADSNLWLYDPTTGQRDSLYAGSREIKEIKPFNNTKSLMPDDVAESYISTWYYEQPSYGSIYADPYKELYYRFARLPKPDHKPGTFNDKPVIVIVLDKDLRYVGEERLPEGPLYDTFNAYVSPEGLNIHIYNSSDEDRLTFYTYNAKF